MAQRSMKVAIIGAGASGILALIKMRQDGLDATIFEKADDIGGTWRDNRYPGLSCDVPSHLYRYSFEPNPEWTQVCSPGPEILEYLRGVVAKHSIAPFIKLGHEVTKAEYANGQWALTTSKGEVGSFDVVLSAVGVLHHPVMPQIEGLDSFEGALFHTSRWDHSVDLKGKRVGVIGTGSTAIQITGAIVDVVKHYTLFQRTAQWIMPLQNPAIAEAQKAAYRADPKLMEEEYQRLADTFIPFASAVAGENPAQYAGMQEIVRNNLETSVRDPALKEKLRPNYQLGCKRIVVSDKFYEAIQKPNAELVTEAITRVEPKGVRTSDGALHELDVLVCATGFNTHQFMRPMEVIGPGGTLEEAWSRRNEGYLGVGIAGFPNFFMIGGPNSPISNFSWLQTAEAQTGFILQLIEKIRSGNAAEIAPKASAVKRFNDEIRAKMPSTVWATGCRSWYLDKNGEVASWPWGFERFAEQMKAPALDDFEVR